MLANKHNVSFHFGWLFLVNCIEYAKILASLTQFCKCIHAGCIACKVQAIHSDTIACVQQQLAATLPAVLQIPY